MAAYDAARVAYAAAGQHEGEARALLAAGEHLQHTGQLKESLARLGAAVSASERVDNPSLAGDVTFALARSYFRVGMTDDAARCCRLARNHYRQANNKRGEAQALNALAGATISDVMAQDNLSVDARGRERWAAAIKVWEDALALARSVGANDLAGAIRYNLALGMDLLGFPARALDAAIELAEAERMSGSVRREVQARMLMGQCLVKLERFAEAVEVLTDAVMRTRKHSLTFLMEDALQTLATALEARGDVAGAIDALTDRMVCLQVRFDDEAVAAMRGHVKSIESNRQARQAAAGG